MKKLILVFAACLVLLSQTPLPSPTNGGGGGGGGSGTVTSITTSGAITGCSSPCTTTATIGFTSPAISTAGKGYWAFGIINDGTTVIPSTGVIRCLNIVPTSVTVRRIGIYITVATAAKGTAVGLYDISGNLLGQGNSVGVGGGGVPFTLGAPVSVVAGTPYIWCFATEDSLLAYAGASDTSALPNLLAVGTDVQIFTAAGTITGTGATYALPATLGAQSFSSFVVPLFILLP